MWCDKQLSASSEGQLASSQGCSESWLVTSTCYPPSSAAASLPPPTYLPVAFRCSLTWANYHQINQHQCHPVLNSASTNSNIGSSTTTTTATILSPKYTCQIEKIDDVKINTWSVSNVILADEKIHVIPSISKIHTQMGYHCVQYIRCHLLSLI